MGCRREQETLDSINESNLSLAEHESGGNVPVQQTANWIHPTVFYGV
jgi:hypothetical protein